MATLTPRSRRYVTIVTYPLSEHSTPVLYLKADNAQDARAKAIEHCVNQGWGTPERVQSILIDNRLAVQHIETVR